MSARMKRYLRSLLLLLALAATPTDLYAKGWESVKSEYADAKTVIKDTELEIKADSGVIIVNTNHPVQIKIFTILGRLVNSETLPAGRARLQLPAHGIYIVKIGDITCKVAV